MTIADLREVAERQQARIEELRAKARPATRLGKFFNSLRLRRSMAVFVIVAVAMGEAGVLAFAADIAAPVTAGIAAGQPISASTVGGNFTTLWTNDQSINAQLTGIVSSQWDGVTDGISYIEGNVQIGLLPSLPKSSLVVSGKIENSYGANIALYAPGTAQGQLVGLSFAPTFSGTSDAFPRRAADIVAGFNGGVWGSEYLSFSVGKGGASNDAGDITLERLRIAANGNVGIGTASPAARLEVQGGRSYLSASSEPFAIGAGYSAAGGKVFFGAASASATPDMVFSNSGGTELLRIAHGGNVGIGTNAPASGFMLDVKQSAARTQAALFEVNNADTAIGYSYGLCLKNIDATLGNFASITNWNSNGIGNAWIDFINVDHSYKGALAFSTRNASGTYGRRLYIDEYGKIGIGRTPTTYRLEVEGDASKTTAGGFLANSDLSIKRDIEEISDAVTTLMRLRPVKFRYSTGYMSQHPSVKDAYYYNYIAQEYREVFPDSVTMTPEGILSMDSHNANVIAVRAIQEQQVEIAALRAEAEGLQAIIAALGARLDALEAETGGR